jgi:hypothetical protein
MDSLDLGTYAARFHIDLEADRAGQPLKKILPDVLSEIASGCVRSGASLIGHIKCVAEDETGGYLRCSALDQDAAPRCEGAIPDGCRRITLTLNVLVYGLGEKILQELTRDAILRGLGDGARVLEDAGSPDLCNILDHA